MSSRVWRIVALGFVLSCGGSGDAGPSGPATVTSVAVSPNTASIFTGGTQQFTATANDAGGNTLTGRTIAWSTSNASVATVNSASGLATALVAGSATITATCEGRSAAATITVVIVPVATVSVTPASTNILIAARQQLTATTRDGNGNTVTGRLVTWSSADATKATVTPAGLVTAVAAGLTTITATSEGKLGAATITVLMPVIAGKVFGLLPGREWLGESRVYVRVGERSDSVDVSADGTFNVPTALASEDSVDLLLDEKDKTNRRFFPVLIALKKADFARVSMVRIPTKWVITKGAYRQQVVSVSLELAYRDLSPDLNGSFYSRDWWPTRGWEYYNWILDESRLPFATAFDRSSSNRPIVAADSVAAWTALRAVDDFWGEVRFRPVNYADLGRVEPGHLVAGVRIVVDTAAPDLGYAGREWIGKSEIVGGMIGVRDKAFFSNGFLMAHEALHVFGVGHTCSWRSVVMGPYCNDPLLQSDVPSLGDVAYSELLRSVQRTVRDYGVLYGLGEAHQGERVYMLGLARQTIFRP